MSQRIAIRAGFVRDNGISRPVTWLNNADGAVTALFTFNDTLAAVSESRGQ